MQDVYQNAKMAKLLIMTDQWKAYLYKEKGLDDIIIDETDASEIEETIFSVPKKGIYFIKMLWGSYFKYLFIKFRTHWKKCHQRKIQKN